MLVYDNAKADRLGRRLPINEATAVVITAQQSRVQQRFPATPAGELKLLPSPRRNPDGRRAISIAMLGDRHREWADKLGPLRSRDGAEFDASRIVPYAYRHTFAQRHADAGVGIDVLAELIDHRNLNVTRGYYRVGEDWRRAAVDTVTAMSFDRHGNRIWREAASLLNSEHARYAIGAVAVPYGRCTEPANVAAGGGACPVRFRCAGCDHFRTDVSYLPDLTIYLDDLLTHATIYWVNNSIATSMRYYANANRYPWAPAHDSTPVVQAPVGLTFVTYENPPGIHTANERVRAFKTGPAGRLVQPRQRQRP